MMKDEIIIALAGMAFSLIFLAILMSNRSKIRQAKIQRRIGEVRKIGLQSRGGSAGNPSEAETAGEGSGRNERAPGFHRKDPEGSGVTFPPTQITPAPDTARPLIAAGLFACPPVQYSPFPPIDGMIRH